MATVTIPDDLLINQEFINAFIEAFHEGKFLPGYWVNHLPNGTLENIKFTKDHNLAKATCYISYPNYTEATVASALIGEWIASSDKSILSKVKQERTLVYFTYNFIKL